MISMAASDNIESGGPIFISVSSEIHGTLFEDAVVQKNCFLHIRGNVRGSLTISEGARVVVEGSVDGKVINKGGSLTVNNHGAVVDYVSLSGPPEAEAGGVLKINLSAIPLNWAALAKQTVAECSAVLKSDAYGCGVEVVAGLLAKSGCRTFFVSDLAEAKRARRAAPDANIYVLGGLYRGTAPVFAQINAQPVINSLIEMAEWDAFVTSSKWIGGFALNVKTGTGRFGISVEEAAGFAPSIHSKVGITLLMSELDNADRGDSAPTDSQLKKFQELRVLYKSVPASLADASCIYKSPNAHFDLVRPGAALFGVNPTPGVANPMLPVIQLQGRIVQVGTMAPGDIIADNGGWTAKKKTRVAIVAVGYADGYPRGSEGNENRFEAVVGGQRCKVVGRASLDSLAVDITDLKDPTSGRHGEMVTLIGEGFTIDDLATSAKSNGGELLRRLGHRFHRIYYAG